MPPKARRGSKQNEQPPESQSRRNAPECRPTSGATRRRVSPPVGSLPLPPSPPTRAKRGQTASDDDGTESIQSCQPHNGGKKQRVNEPLGLSTSGSSSWPLPQASQNAVSAPNPIATHNTDVPTPGRVTSAPGRALGATTVASSTVSLNRRAQNEGSTAQASQQRQRPNPRAPRTRLTGISPPRTRGGPSNRTISNTNEVITGSTAVVGPRATGRGREEPRTRAKSKRTENRDRGMSTSTRSAVRAALLTKKERIPRKGKSDTDAFSSTVSMDCGAEDARDGGDGGNGGSGSGSGRDRDRKNNEPNRTRKRPCPTQASNDRRRKRTQRARSGSTSSGAAASVSRDALATGEVGLAALLEATTTCGGAFNSGVQPAPAPNTVPGVSTASGGRRSARIATSSCEERVSEREQRLLARQRKISEREQCRSVTASNGNTDTQPVPSTSRPGRRTAAVVPAPAQHTAGRGSTCSARMVTREFSRQRRIVNGEDTSIPADDVRARPATGAVGSTERNTCGTSARQSIATNREDERNSQRMARASSRGPRFGRRSSDIIADQSGGSETITAAVATAAEGPSPSLQPSPQPSPHLSPQPSPQPWPQPWPQSSPQPIVVTENRREALGRHTTLGDQSADQEYHPEGSCRPRLESTPPPAAPAATVTASPRRATESSSAPPTDPPSWATYVAGNLRTCRTDSWLLVPLLLDAIGMEEAAATWRFQRPESWENYVVDLRVTLTAAYGDVHNLWPLVSTRVLGSVIPNYIAPVHQEDLVGVNAHMTNALVPWILSLRRGTLPMGVDLPQY